LATRANAEIQSSSIPPRQDIPSTAWHGEGRWDPKPIAVSLNGLREALTAVAKAAKGRENPIALEQYPITTTERKTVLEEIRQHNPDIDLFFWALMMGDDLEGR